MRQYSGVRRRAIFLLSHAGSHPNLLYNPDKEKGNWIPPEVEEQLLPTFRWSPEEIASMLRSGMVWAHDPDNTFTYGYSLTDADQVPVAANIGRYINDLIRLRELPTN